MNRWLTGILLLAAFLRIQAQPQENPRLVLGIVVDQMRFDYIYKYWDKYGEGGIKRLVNEGFQCKNLQYNYVPTYTAPGHASVYTGTTPARHGIIGNDWFAREKGRTIYCAGDETVQTVGSSSEKPGRMSPRNMLSTTVSDELRIASNFRSKVIGIALKDRGAIMPAGHTANAAYWFDGDSGNWITSSFYMDKLPDWLVQFNKKQPALAYLKQKWEPLLPIDQYTESLADENTYEGFFKGLTQSVFPYDLPKLMEKNGGQHLIKATPFGNSLTKDIAIAAMTGEELGKDEFTDLLCVSFSSTDYVGHQFGPGAIETEDTYIRFDRDLAALLAAAEQQAGKGRVLVFLTADHGGDAVPAYLMEKRVPGGYFDHRPMRDSVKTWMKKVYGTDIWLMDWNNEQFYLDETAIEAAGRTVEEVEEYIARRIGRFDGVQSVTTASRLRRENYTQGTPALVQKGYHAKRSGNVFVTLEPNWMEFSRTGTTHGSPYSYDTRVPMLWYGWRVQHGETALPYFIDDIAPTLSWLLNIPFPNATSGNPIPLPLKD